MIYNSFGCILLVLFVISVVIIITGVRSLLRRQAKVLSEEIKNAYSYRNRSGCEIIEKTSPFKVSQIVDIPTDINNSYCGKIISSSDEKDFTSYYADLFNRAYSLSKKLRTLRITPLDSISKFIDDYGAIRSIVKRHNDDVIQSLLETHKDFFDHCLKYPLDRQQRRSVISEEDNCLVVSSAGSGKTSSIVGKVKYLTEIKGIAPQKILLVSYTNKAASELTERIGIAGLRGYTFHKLALDLIGQVTGVKPSICDNSDALLVKIYRTLVADTSFRKNVVEYFADYQSYETDFERWQNEKREQLAEQKRMQLKALFPDMDGKPIYVRSEQERKICFVLYSLGVSFRYEEPYEYPLADEMHSQYKPDFSIYYEHQGITKRIYLEHFGIDEHGLVPMWFAKDNNISYEEANRRYNDGITWKRAAHEKFGTELITTSSADFHCSDIKETLKNALSQAGVPIQEKTAADIYNEVLPEGSNQEKAFIRLAATFVTLLKSSCKTFDDVLRQAKSANDERNSFVITKIFKPVYERYVNALRECNQIDFTDAILQATEICRSCHPVEYDYIIVDEFQDISVDRYNFLKALRCGNPPAKLYCVGDDWQSIYRFSGSDMALFNQFSDYFGPTEINKIETTYRFGEPLVTLSSQFIQSNDSQIKKNIHPFSAQIKTDLVFQSYDQNNYNNTVEQLVAQIPSDKSVFLLGRYSFDDYYLSFKYQSLKKGNRFYYVIGEREIEFLTVHKSKGLEADYVILLQCNKDTYGFPSLVNDDSVLRYVLTESDKFPYGEERRLFYVAITRAKIRTIVLYDSRFPSVFVNEFLHPKQVTDDSYSKFPNANKRWTPNDDKYLLRHYHEGESIKSIAAKMGRSQTSIVMRLGKLKQ